MQWRSKHTPGWLLPLMLLAAAGLFRYFWYVSPWFVPSEIIGGKASVADKISAASALFSVFAFVGLLYAVLLQREEIIAQREDQSTLAQQVDEQRRHLRVQTQVLSQQSFENTFFHLLRLHNANVKSQTVRISAQRKQYKGRAAFVEAAAEIEGHLADRLRRQPNIPITLQEVNDIYTTVCEQPNSQFGHYFRNLYHIVKYIHESSIEHKPRYASQVRAQFSQAEYELLTVNGLRNLGNSKFKPLIEEYSLLHEMRVSAPYYVLKTFYSDSASSPETRLLDSASPDLAERSEH